MKIADEFERMGNWLFQRRSYFPLLILPLMLVALRESEGIEKHFGDKALTLWETVCVSISFCGLLLRSLTVAWVPEGTSGRNTKGQLAEFLNTEGPYSLARHPLYLANFMITFGFALFVQVWWFVLLFVLFFCLFYERIIFAEEAFLERKFGQAFRDWADRTPVFIPRFALWKKPRARFSWRMILKREYSTFFGIIVAFIAIKFFAELLAEGELTFRFSWWVLIGIGFAVYITLRTIRKKTKWLEIRS